MDKVRITESEWLVMEEVWNGHPITAARVVENLQGKTDWKNQTIRTLLTRLTKKNFVRMLQKGSSYLYEPLVDRKSVVDEESSSFLNRVFDGSCKPLVLHFVEQGRLTPEELRDLKQALDKIETDE